MKKINPVFVGYGIAIILIFWIAYLLLKKVGLIRKKTAEEKETEVVKEGTKLTKAKSKALQTDVQNIMQNSGLFSPTKWQSIPPSYLLNTPTAKIKAKSIEDSFGFFNDDEEQIYAVFRSLTDKGQVSQIAYEYANLFNSDLLGDLFEYLGKNELYNIWIIILNIK